LCYPTNLALDILPFEIPPFSPFFLPTRQKLVSVVSSKAYEKNELEDSSSCFEATTASSNYSFTDFQIAIKG
jgi:hypothetical protein